MSRTKFIQTLKTFESIQLKDFQTLTSSEVKRPLTFSNMNSLIVLTYLDPHNKFCLWTGITKQ